MSRDPSRPNALNSRCASSLKSCSAVAETNVSVIDGAGGAEDGAGGAVGRGGGGDDGRGDDAVGRAQSD